MLKKVNTRKMLSMALAALMILQMIIIPANAADTGTAYPGTVTTSGTGTNWTNPSNISNNTNDATVTLSGSGSSRLMNGTNFGFNIPEQAVIQGIQVDVRRNSSGSGNRIRDLTVRLYKNGSLAGNNKAAGGNWPATKETAPNGDSIHLWGTT